MIKKLKGPLWLQVLIAMALGLTTGLLLAPSGAGILSERAVHRRISGIGEEPSLRAPDPPPCKVAAAGKPDEPFFLGHQIGEA